MCTFPAFLVFSLFSFNTFKVSNRLAMQGSGSLCICSNFITLHVFVYLSMINLFQFQVISILSTSISTFRLMFFR